MLFFIILILSFASRLFLPWWVVVVIAFVAALFVGKTARQSFFSGFGATFLTWLVLALLTSIPNDHILAKRMAILFHLPWWWLIFAVTSVIGGLVTGIAALSGLLVKDVMKSKTQKS